MSSFNLDVCTEIGPLEVVVVSPPGDEFNRMVPANLVSELTLADGRRTPNPDYLMFDDLVLLERMQLEHRQLAEVLAAVTGDRGVHTVRGLIATALAEETARREAISSCLALEEELYGVAPAELHRHEALMLSLGPVRLTDLLFTGVERYTQQRVLRWPIPNALFARDLGAAMGTAFVLTHAARAGRRRDMMLMRLAVRHHPLFAGVELLDVLDDGPVRTPDGDPVATVEGGDIQILDGRIALIGVSLRTTAEAARRLAPRLLAQGLDAVVCCELPRQRGSMHIDTLFTQISPTECLVFPPLVTDPASLGLAVSVTTAQGRRDAGQDLLVALRDLGLPLDPVWCGGDDPISQQREQWSDGANAFALAPGVIVTYARNVATLRQLGLHGYRTVTPQEFCRNAAFYLGGGHRLAVAIDGTELVRGRGGPRCLTMPLRRGHLA